jgi:chaperonin GroES
MITRKLSAIKRKTHKNMKKNAKTETPVKKISTVGILPLGDRVLIKRTDSKELEKSGKFGIIIPDTVSKEKPEQGKVVAVGEGRRDESGNIIPMLVKIGDTVIFSKYSYDEVKSGDEEYVMVKEENILAITK